MPRKKDNDVKQESGDKKVFKRSDDFVSLYVNNTTFGFTRFDFQIIFGRVEVTRDEAQDHTNEIANITMTPEYAKALLGDLAKVLNEYENKHGEIQIRPDVTQQS